MTKMELLDNFRNGFLLIDGLNEEYNLNETNKNDQFYNNEYLKFLHMLKCYFFNKNRLVTVINSYEIELKNGIIAHIFDLLIHFYESNEEYNYLSLCLFLMLFEESLKQPEHCKCITHKSNLKEFNSLKEKYKEQLTNAEQKVNEFFIEATKYYIENDEILITDMVFAIMKIANEMTKNVVIEQYLKINEYYWLVFQFDKNINKHKDMYLNHIISCIKLNKNEEQFLKMLENMCKKNILSVNDQKNVINEYIIRTNNLKLLFEGEDNLIRGLSEIEELISHFNILKRIIRDRSIKDKIQKCIINILYYKRLILSNPEYVNSNMQEIRVSEEIPASETEKLKRIINEDTTSYFSLMLVSLSGQIKLAIDSYLKSPLWRAISHFELDTVEETYNTWKDSTKQDDFTDYINEIGNQYADSIKVKLDKSPYDILMQNEKNIFNYGQRFIFAQFSKSEYIKKIEDLKKELRIKSNNSYATMTELIIKSEYSVIRILERLGIEPNYKDGYENFSKLFKYVNENYEDSVLKENIINGLFYIIYVFYEKFGYNLRNNVMHGVLIAQKNELELLMAYTCYIIILGIENDFKQKG